MINVSIFMCFLNLYFTHYRPHASTPHRSHASSIFHQRIKLFKQIFLSHHRPHASTPHRSHASSIFHQQIKRIKQICILPIIASTHYRLSASTHHRCLKKAFPFYLTSNTRCTVIEAVFSCDEVLNVPPQL